MRAGRIAAFLLATLVGGCATNAATPSPTARQPSLTPAVSASEQLFPAGSHFDSSLYGFSLDLPDGWRPDPATERWDGTYGTFGSDSLQADRFHFQKGYTVWAVAAPTTATLQQFVAGQDASDARRHECPRHPDGQPATIGSEDALLEMKHCPTDSAAVIGMAATIHRGVGYFFYFIHPVSVEASNDDQQVFQSLLDTVTFAT
jgi:hypothetical protein